MFQRSTDKDKDKVEEPKEAKPARESLKKVPPTIISSDMSMLGNMVSEGAIDIDGAIDGNVKAQSVIIRKNGLVRGDVAAESVQVYGNVQGVIKAKTVQLFASAKVEGTIMHEKLTIEDGAFVDGQFKRVEGIADDMLLLQHDALTGDEDEDDVFKRLKLIST